jgi:hypothetical protein
MKEPIEHKKEPGDTEFSTFWLSPLEMSLAFYGAAGGRRSFSSLRI